MTLSLGSIDRTESRARKLGSGVAVGVRMEMEAGSDSSLNLHTPLP
jgi:hypothetical protein